jgi:hypothetical protein
VKKGDEIKITSGRYAGKRGQVLRCWSWLRRGDPEETIVGFQIIVHRECRGEGPKVVSLAPREIQIVSAVDLLAQKAL